MKQYRRSFRFVCSESEKSVLKKMLSIQGFTWDEEEFTENVCRLIDEPFSLGSSLASFFGFIYIQDRASMLPPVALAPPKGAFVLDMCASPGSKTGQLASMVGKTGFVLGNEPSPSRLATLRRNLQQMNFTNAASCCYSGQNLPLPPEFFDYIQLDPPCSGWGTIERNPNVLDMWKDDKTQPLIRLQKELLQEAYRLLKPNGVMVYSTCTTNIEENEQQVLYAKELGFSLEELPCLPEFEMDMPLLGIKGVWRLSPKMGDTQGFFVARFHKKPKGNTENEVACEEKYRYEASLLNPEVESSDSVLETTWGNPLRTLKNIGLEKSLLDQGEVSIFGESVHFVHKKACALPQNFLWQGMYMGKVSKHGDIALSPRVRLEGDLPCVYFEDTKGIEQIKGLLSGQSFASKDLYSVKNQSLDMQLKGAKSALFYWNGLLLGRLKVKNTRFMWTER